MCFRQKQIMLTSIITELFDLSLAFTQNYVENCVRFIVMIAQ